MLNTQYRTHMLESQRGFGLVELMVAVVVGLMAILAIMSVFVTSEAQKRTTTGGADAQENAVISLVTLERDLRVAGLGLVGLGCNSIAAYNATLIPSTFTFAPLPVTITRDAPAVGNDTIVVAYSTSAYGNIPTSLKGAMPTSDAPLTAAIGDGFVQGDIIMISEPPKACALVQASANAVNSATGWTLAHDSGAPYPFNPPAATNIFPAGGYQTGARVTNMGALIRREYFVQNSSLMVRNLNIPDSAVAPLNPMSIVNGVTAMRAQYGRDTNADGYIDVYDNTAPADPAQLVAVRIAVAARSGQLEKDVVSPATLTLWNGGTIADGGAIALDATAQRYRYKVHQTTVPLRNVIWTNN
ncbi:MAG TPA: PilW family protein [Burkholderiales bacterium]|nr:PilW family protein [Burkholderiales bacterium]